MSKKLKNPGFSGPAGKRWGHTAPSAKTKAPHDATYGSSPDMLDKRGMIVEPDVRRKVAKYFKKMKLREMIRELIIELFESSS